MSSTADPARPSITRACSRRALKRPGDGRRGFRDRSRHARLRVHGQGSSNAFRKIAYMTWPPPLQPRLVAIAGRNEQAVSEAATRATASSAGRRTGRSSWRTRRSGSSTTWAPTTSRGADHRRRRSRQARRLREASRTGCGRELRHLASCRGHGREAHVRVQLPLRPCSAARARDDRGGRARGASSLPGSLSAGLGRHDRAGLAVRPRGRRLGAWATSPRTSSISPAIS